MNSERQSLFAVKLACVLGLIHAGFSLYWMLGGRWLLATVGQWAVDLANQAPTQGFLILLFAAIIKGLGAIIPLLNAQKRMPWPRLWRGINWIGGPFLIVYGGANMLIALAVLLGWIQPAAPIDQQGLIGHAFLWDPLFFFWGLALTWHLWRTRTSNQRTILDQ